jgi:sulfur-carrier protein
MARVTLLYFAAVREAVGLGEETLELADGVETPRDLARSLATRSAGHAAAFAEPERLRCAVDQIMVPFDAPLGAAREIAFFPPVTGG